MPHISDKERRRVVKWGLILLIVLVALVMISAVLSPYVDYLWFSHDVRQPQVFTRGYETKGLLFLPAFFLTWALLHLSLKRAFKLSLIYLEGPTTTGQAIMSNALHFVQEKGWGLVRVFAPIVAFFSANGFSNEWNTFLMARHSQSFGIKDPLYGMDLSFFVFTLPWYRALVGYAFGVVLLTTIFTIAVYAGLQLLAAMAKVELGRPNVRLHISLLTGLTLLILAGTIFLKTFEFGFATGSQFTGAGFAASFQMQAQKVAALAVAVLALGTMLMARSARVYDFLLKFGIVVVVLSILGVGVAPAIIQKVMVEPDKLTKEGPFAKRAIDMTRYAYALDKIVPQDFPIQDVPSKADLLASQSTLDNMRLWDPEIVRQSIEMLQSLKQFYRFTDVDVDRYKIGGKLTEVMLSPRDIYLDGLQGNSRSWLYERLQYTHGYGVVMAPVNAATPDGEPNFLIKDMPPITPVDIPLDQPRIYFSDFRDDMGSPTDEYALVHSKQPEFDYPAQDKEQTTEWQGSGGIPIGGFFRRLALSVALGDGNLLVSGNVTADTKLLMHRSIIDRCTKLYPFLRLDDDPYIVLIGGKVYWILDGYTSTDRIPYSGLMGEGDNRLNYIRNSVKIVVNAYSGETTAYAVDAEEPILKAYRAIYPGLVHDASEVPAGFREHFRYPEDLFRVQAAQLTLYHVTDPIAFLNNNDAWETPVERSTTGSRTPLAPYYVQMSLPGEATDGFVLMLPFTPRGKSNMSGWLAAHCDPERYGQTVLYKFAKGANVAGAEQAETTFASDPKVNGARLQLQGGGTGDTDVVIGNMLVIPIGKSVLYAESLFPKSRTSGLQARPRLKKVVLGINGRVEVGDTYAEALERLFGPATAPTQVVQPGPTPTTANKDPLTNAREALGLLDQADAALKAGDFAKYGALQKQARERLRELVSK